MEGLPAPVQRYFRAVLTDGQPIIAAATLEMAGTINLSANAEQWKPLTSNQRVVTSAAGLRPGFLWNAQVNMFPGVSAHVEDSYAPTLVISARDDRYGTYVSAQYTASSIAGAKFIGFDEGGHTWVGHDDEVRAAIVELLVALPSP